jgi:hypothetical protein
MRFECEALNSIQCSLHYCYCSVSLFVLCCDFLAGGGDNIESKSSIIGRLLCGCRQRLMNLVPGFFP